MSDEFLSPGKYCRWSSKAALVKQAKKLARRSTRDTITEVYRYVATRFAYDTEKARRLNGTRGTSRAQRRRTRSARASALTRRA